MTKPNISLIAAMDRNRLIGSKNRMPWKIPEDLAYFRKKTLGHTVIMGKNTWLSLGSTLDQRTNIVMTRDTTFSVPGVIVCNEITDVFGHCGDEECFVIGGAQIFKLFLPLAQTLYITKIEAEFEGDTYFPALRQKDWETVFFEVLESKTGYTLQFHTYKRRSVIPKLR